MLESKSLFVTKQENLVKSRKVSCVFEECFRGLDYEEDANPGKIYLLTLSKKVMSKVSAAHSTLYIIITK